jgi:formyl-CoA transferase
VIEAPQLATDPRFATNADRSNNRRELNEAINAITRGKTSAEWIAILNAAGVPCGPIYSIDQVFADPQVRHLNVTRHVAHKVLGDVEVIGQAVELSRTPWGVHSPTPEPGEHTDAVLRELGYGAAEIADLRARKVV